MELWAFFTGTWEWIIVVVVAVLLFGRRLPEIGRSLGRGIVEFKKGVKEVEDEIEDSSEPKKSGSGPPPEDNRAEPKPAASTPTSGASDKPPETPAD